MTSDSQPDNVAPPADDGFVSNILTPGSSLNPVFLYIVDGVLASLMTILLALLVLSRGSIHFVFLILITGCLWASVKWFVAELQNAPAEETSPNEDTVSSEKLKSANGKLKDE
ncbi:hypothetical protein C8Q80DRAFT_1268545 [Daedaleopsis nitida]|nr:hypothetical protein C8Q80DRAFT_1268545 [Daedaleopsis nitida]